jgi:tetratricopeptide (TPR) repeat protein
LRKAGVAAGAEQFFEPASDSALFYIQQAEAEAQRLGASSGGAALLRRLYGNQFRSLGNSLLGAKLNDLAAVRFGEALRFLPGDADLRTKLGLAAEARAASEAEPATGVTPGARRPVDETARAAADLFSAAAAGRFSQARVALAHLLDTDKEGRQSARLADEFRRRAQTLWAAGERGEARRHYQLVANLDPEDSVSRERADSKDEPKPAPIVAAPVEPPPTPEPARRGKKKVVAGVDTTTSTSTATASPEDDGAPRDRAASAKAAADGAGALSRGDLVRAQVAFDRAVRMDASNPNAVAGLAEVAFENARYTEALDYGRRAVRLQPKAPRYHEIVGDAFFKLLRYDEAQAAYKRAQALSPNDEGIKARLGRVKARLGE